MNHQIQILLDVALAVLYFIVVNIGQAITINSEHSTSMITNFFWTEFDDMDNKHMWFQQGSIMCHTAKATCILYTRDLKAMSPNVNLL